MGIPTLPSRSYFNPKLVRFKPKARAAVNSYIRNFNPKLVRFKLRPEHSVRVRLPDFNPKLVRFKRTGP